MKLLTKIFGTRNDKLLKEIRPLVNRINELESSFRSLNDEQIKDKTKEFKSRFDRGESIDALLPEAYANCREAARRSIGQRHFDVQLSGGIVLKQGKIAEMKTGEGKTLTATLPSYLHGLSGKGAHVVTVNDYLAKRDAQWMGAIYNALGLTVGSILHGLNDRQRKESYAADITYGTNNEFGFDYLRDNMKTNTSRMVQREHNFAIVDEVDSILIDEARTPLIISGATETNTQIYNTVNTTIPGLQKDSDYILDEKNRNVSLTEDGISKLEKRLKITNLYDPSNLEYLHHVQQALKAHVIFKKDVDYVVRDGEILIVDEFTGRLMPGRRYSDGLHGALEAKEHVQVQQETQTLATVTFQNYFRLYNTLSGMTGTADTEAVEFNKIYNLDVVVIPPNKTIIRKDENDVVYRTMREKFEAIADDIKKAQDRGQPILVGTVSVEKSELLSKLLHARKVTHDVLNAKHHAREADIIKSAGNQRHVTIATNMAGRGTDIVLGEGVKEAGGLYVIGTERHESRRIDNQLRGRSGRQGDHGKSKFFLSLEDDLMRIFASDRLSAIMQRLGMEDGEAIVSPMVTKAIEKAQRRVEEQNFSSRKNLLEYDDVMNQQRQVVYQRRRNALMQTGELPFFKSTVEDTVAAIGNKYSPEAIDAEHWDLVKAQEEFSREFNQKIDLSSLDHEDLTIDHLTNYVSTQIQSTYQNNHKTIDIKNTHKIENIIYLQTIDMTWKEHLLSMDALKDSVSLRGYAQRDPLQEYKKEAFNLFSSMMTRIEEETTMSLLRMPFTSDIATNLEALVDEEDDDGSYDYIHDDPTKGQPKSNDDKMIYYGDNEDNDSTQETQQPFQREGEKVGRNEPCPCGSGKKFKKCHGSK